MASLPMYDVSELEDVNNKPCRECPLNTDQCPEPLSPLLYTKMGAPERDLREGVDIIVFADPPTKKDIKAKRYWSDQAASEAVQRFRDLGADRFIVAPAVRCHPMGDIDHFRLTKKYKAKKGEEERKAAETSRDRAFLALSHCRKYSERLLRQVPSDQVIAMGPLASETMGLGASVGKGRTSLVHGAAGLEDVHVSGTIVTHDRPMLKRSEWALAQFRADMAKVKSLREKGYAHEFGRHDNIKVTVMDTVKDALAFIRWVSTAKFKPDTVLSIDYETENLYYSTEDNRILNVGFCVSSNPNQAYVIPLDHPETPFGPDESALIKKKLKKLFRSKDVGFSAWTAHYAAFELAITKTFFDVWLGFDGGIPVICTELESSFLDEDRKALGIKKPNALETLSSELFNFTWYKETNIKARRAALSEEPIERVNEYVGIDAVQGARVHLGFVEMAKDEGSYDDMLRLTTKLLSDGLHYTTDLTLTGQRIDIDALYRLRDKDSPVQKRIHDIREWFTEQPEVEKASKFFNSKKKKSLGDIASLFDTGHRVQFSLGKADHLRALFWHIFQLEGADTSVDKKFREDHRGHRFVDVYSEYQTLSRLDTGYLTPVARFLQSPTSRDGRLRPRFHLGSTKTGRLSGTDPNSQNLPAGRDNVQAKAVKSMFICAPGYVLVQLDFSQAEVRWLGVISGDKALKAKYERALEIDALLREDPNNEELNKLKKIDGDIHMSTALMMYKKPESIVWENYKEAKLLRQKAKAVCFGLIYGKSTRSLASDLGISIEEAEEAVTLWLGQFPRAAQWLEEIQDFAKENGYVRSPFGRRRRLPEVYSTDQGLVNRALRQARNTPIQGAASDCCIYAASKLRRVLMSSDNPEMRAVRLINTVHDSLIAEVPATFTAVKEYARIAQAIFTDRNLLMEDFGVYLTVPMAVDFDVGANWGNTEDYNFTDESLRAALHNAGVLRGQPPGTTLDSLKGKGLLYGEAQAA